MKLNTIKNVKSWFAGAALALLPLAGHGQYLADIQTVNPDTQVPEARLFLDPGFTVPASIGTRMWFVVDTDGGGLPDYSLGIEPGNVLGNELLLLSDTVDGEIFGDLPGFYSRFAIEVNDPTFASRNIYAFLWGAGNPTSEADVLPGMRFDVFDIGARQPPPIGNANWFITQNMDGSQYTVVPEPAAVVSAVVYLGVGLAGLAFLRRRFARSKPSDRYVPRRPRCAGSG